MRRNHAVGYATVRVPKVVPGRGPSRRERRCETGDPFVFIGGRRITTLKLRGTGDGDLVRGHGSGRGSALGSTAPTEDLLIRAGNTPCESVEKGYSTALSLRMTHGDCDRGSVPGGSSRSPKADGAA